MDSRKFFVQIGETKSVLFSKSTLLNLADFAEKRGATELVLLLDSQHPEKNLFKKIFHVVDVERMRSSEVALLLNSASRQSLKEVILKDNSFYKMAL